MRFKVTSIVNDYDDKPLREDEVKLSINLINGFEKLVNENKITASAIIESMKNEVKKEPLTFRIIINNALNSLVNEGDRPEILSGTDKAKCYEITKKIFSSKEPELTDDQVTFILQRVEKVYLLPIICGRVREFLKR